MTDYHKVYLQLRMYLTTVTRSIQVEFQENTELEQASFESLERLCYLKGQVDLLDDIDQTLKRLTSQD